MDDTSTSLLSLLESTVPIPNDNPDNASNSEDGQSKWRLFGRRVSKSELVFGTQIVMLYIVIIVCLVNLTVGNGDSNLWTALLSSSLGYMLLNPTLKTLKRT